MSLKLLSLPFRYLIGVLIVSRSMMSVPSLSIVIIKLRPTSIQSPSIKKRFLMNFFSPLVLVTPKQIERLYSRFTSLDRSDCGTLSREDFLRIPELAINPLCDRIVHSFIADSNDDRVNFRQFMQVLARFRTIKKGKENKLNSREEKMRCETVKQLKSSFF